MNILSLIMANFIIGVLKERNGEFEDIRIPMDLLPRPLENGLKKLTINGLKRRLTKSRHEPRKLHRRSLTNTEMNS